LPRGGTRCPGSSGSSTEAAIVNLPILRDPKSDLARASAVMGLPVTLILNPEGQEVARLIGDAEWDSDSAKAIMAALWRVSRPLLVSRHSSSRRT
jgi:hypothetical protein